jgi:hypothetical protein
MTFDVSKLISLVGLISALITSALGVEGFIPPDWSAWLLLGSTLLTAAGKRLIQVVELGSSSALSVVLVAVSMLSIVAGQANLIGDKWSTMAAGISAMLLVTARSMFGWNEPSTEEDNPPVV